MTTCEHCLYFVPRDGAEIKGTCHGMPPATNGKRPPIQATDVGCSLFRAATPPLSYVPMESLGKNEGTDAAKGAQTCGVTGCTELGQRYGAWLLATRIPVNTRLTQAQVEGVPIYEYDAGCRGAKAYQELVEEILPRM